MSEHQQPRPDPGAGSPAADLFGAPESFARRLRTVVYDDRSTLPSLLDGLADLGAQLEQAPMVGVLLVRVDFMGRPSELLTWEQMAGIYDALAFTARSMVGVHLRSVDMPADLGLAEEGFAVLLSRPRERDFLRLADVQKVAERYSQAIAQAFEQVVVPELVHRLSVHVGSGIVGRPEPGQTLEESFIAGLAGAYQDSLRLRADHFRQLAGQVEDALHSASYAVSYETVSDIGSGAPVGFWAMLSAPGDSPFSGDGVLLDAARSTGLGSALCRAYHARAISGAKADLREDEWLLLRANASELIGSAVVDLAALFDDGSVRGIAPFNLVFVADSLDLFASFPASLSAFKAVGDIGFRLGVDIALDSLPPLGRLRALSPDLVRLGGRLVETLPTDPDSLELAMLLSRFCRRHGVKLLGSDCRTAAQLAALRRVGVDLVQGAYVGPPAESPSRRSFNLA